MHLRTLACACWVIIILTVCFAAADDWGPPTLEHWSPGRKHRLRIQWDVRSRKAPTLIFDARTATGLKEIWRTTSPQDAAPVRVFISRDGKSVVLLDQWGRAGRGISLVIIDARGAVLSKYTPQQVLPEQDLRQSFRSISSFHWTRGAILFFRAAKPQFAFISARRTVRVFDLATGEIVPLANSERRAVLDEAVPESRALLTAKDPSGRQRPTDPGASGAAGEGPTAIVPATQAAGHWTDATRGGAVRITPCTRLTAETG